MTTTSIPQHASVAMGWTDTSAAARIVRRMARYAWVALALVLVGCEEPELALPSESDVQELYGPAAEVTLNGNVLDVRVEQDPSQLARGGSLWARVGPYIYLFSPQTREAFERFDGLAAVRVRTFRPDGERVAEAMLRRDTLTSVTWQEATRRVARAREEGTERPRYMEELVRFGEDYAEYEYAPRHQDR